MSDLPTLRTGFHCFAKEFPLNAGSLWSSYLLLPTVAEAIIRAQELAITMEAHGFGALPKRTSLFTLRLRARDVTALALLPVKFGALLYFGTLRRPPSKLMRDASN